jgi:ABC-type polysaccharide/polyol phosphate transport system ATPase subunit
VSTAIVVDNISKSYRLGELRGAGQLRDRILSLLGRGEDVEEDAQTVWALKNVAFSVERGEVVGLRAEISTGGSTKSWRSPA